MNNCETIDIVDIVCGVCTVVNIYGKSTHNIYAVYRLTMIHDSDTLFHSEANYFQDDARRKMLVDRSYPILAETRAGFQRLYQVNGNNLPVYGQHKIRWIFVYQREQVPL